MTRSRSSRGRRRRERPVDAPNPEHIEAPAEEVPVLAPASPPRQRDYPRQGGDQSRNPRAAHQDGERPPREGGQGPHGGPGRGNRRRQQRRHQMAPMSSEILRPRAPVTGGDEPIALRTIAELEGPNGPTLGCPMLTRTRIGLPVTGGHPAPRCSLAWALHSEREARYCMETHDLTQCWRAHPENLDAIKDRLGELVAEPTGD